MRVHRLSSNTELFKKEVDNIRSMMEKNSYPTWFLDKTINEFLSRTVDQGTEQPIQQLPTESVSFLNIPYIGKPSTRFQYKLERGFRQHDVKVMVAFNTTKVGSYFCLKSRCSRLFRSNVVYRFTCSDDRNISYIGESKRQLYKRITEHSKNGTNSAVFDHLYKCASCQNFDNIADLFTILRSCKPTNILSSEALLIAKHRPTLNTQLGPGRGTLVSLNIFK